MSWLYGILDRSKHIMFQYNVSKPDKFSGNSQTVEVGGVRCLGKSSKYLQIFWWGPSLITKGAEKLLSKQDTIFQTAKFRRLVNLGVALFTTPI